jgi:hypothetical protein
MAKELDQPILDVEAEWEALVERAPAIRCAWARRAAAMDSTLATDVGLRPK